MNKNQELLYKIIEKHPRASITVLMKIAYIIDLISHTKTNKQISDMEWKRYFYGPFDAKVYLLVEEMLKDKIIKAETRFTMDNDYVVYEILDENHKINKLADNEIIIIDDTMKELAGYGARTLTEIAYKTSPMKKLGATLGGNEHLDEKLIL